jgi:hypothetical protein
MKQAIPVRNLSLLTSAVFLARAALQEILDFKNLLNKEFYPKILETVQ